MHSNREDTWCCFGGHTIPEEEISVEGKVGTICLSCVSSINKNVNEKLLSARTNSYPFLFACMQPRILSMFALTESHDLKNPSYIMPRLFGQRYTSIMDFLESVLEIVSEQADAGCNLPVGFDEGLVHILHEDKALCGFTPNAWRHWPEKQHFTTMEENFAGLTCPQCIMIGTEKFPNHSALAS